MPLDEVSEDVTDPRPPADGPPAPAEDWLAGHRGVRAGLVAVGALMVATSLLMNEWVVARLVGRASGARALGERLTEQVRSLEAIGILIGLALILHRRVVLWGARLMRTRAVRFVLVRPDVAIVLAAVPLTGARAAFWVFAAARDEIPFWIPAAICSLVYSVLLTAMLFVLASAVATKLTRLAYMPVVVCLPWAVLIPVETAIYYFGRTRLERQYLGLASIHNVGPYVSWASVLLFCAVAGLCLLSGILLCRHARRITWAGCARLGVLLLALWVVNVPFLVHRLSSVFAVRAMARNALDVHYARLRYLQTDPVARLVWEAIPRPSKYQRITSLEPFREVIGRYRLPLEDQQYAPLGVRPFRRVILVLAESLSSYFLRTYNPKLPGTLTPFLDSPAVTDHSLRDHHACAQPTWPGLVVTFCSHPNAAMLRETGLPNSFVKVLKDHQWRTAMACSVPRVYDEQHRWLDAGGFGELYAIEHWMAVYPDDRKFAGEWGELGELCDRNLFSHCKDYLLAHRDERVFLAILGTDTHTPFGRRNYHGLVYPSPPEWIARFPALANSLRAVFNYDHDLKTFLTDLASAGLFDEDTLIVITADHCVPSNPALAELPGADLSPFERIPLIFLSRRPLPPYDRDRRTSQLDVAPSILHLLGLPVPAGYWGRSIFDASRGRAPFVGVFRGIVTFEDDGRREEFDLEAPSTAAQHDLRRLMNAYLRPPD